MKVIEIPHTHLKKYDFLAFEDFEKLYENISLLKWELYDKGSYKYLVSSIDYDNDYFKINKSIVENFISPEFISALSSLLNIEIIRCNNFTIHKMEEGHFSKKHHDKNPYGEVARVVYYLSEPSSYKGGELIMFSKDGKVEIDKCKMPTNSFFAFRLTDKFYHEVTKIKSGKRYCIVVTYV